MEITQTQKQETLSTVKIGKTLALARKARGLNQTELAKQVGLRGSYISQIESNDKVPTLQTLEAICDALAIPSGIILLKAKVDENVKEEDKSVFATLINALDELYFNKVHAKAKTDQDALPV